MPLGIAGPRPGAPQGDTPPEGKHRPDSARHAARTGEELAALVEAGAPIGIGGPGRHGGDGPGKGHHDRDRDGAGGFSGPPPANGDGNQQQSFDESTVGNAPA